jgi:fumarate hydratase, class II
VRARYSATTSRSTWAALRGNFELNVFKPMVILQFPAQRAALARRLRESFDEHCASRHRAQLERIRELMARSLMLVTALEPPYRLRQGGAIAKNAHAEGLSLKAAALALGYVSEDEFERWVRPEAMTRPGPQ